MALRYSEYTFQLGYVVDNLDEVRRIHGLGLNVQALFPPSRIFRVHLVYSRGFGHHWRVWLTGYPCGVDREQDNSPSAPPLLRCLLLGPQGFHVGV